MSAQRGDFDAPPAPDPRFRDQLAEALAANGYRPATHAGILDALLPLVEARVQAASNHRAAEALELAYREDRTTVAKLSPVERLTCYLVKVEDLVTRAAALRETT